VSVIVPLIVTAWACGALHVRARSGNAPAVLAPCGIARPAALGLAVAALVGGLVAVAVGLGGGMVLAPLLVGMSGRGLDVQPAAAAATSAACVLAASASACCQYAALGDAVPWGAALPFAAVATAGSAWGVSTIRSFLATRAGPGADGAVAAALAGVLVVCSVSFLLAASLDAA